MTEPADAGSARTAQSAENRVWPTVIAAFVALLLVSLFDEEERFDELALGAHTISRFATYEGSPIHTHQVDEIDAVLKASNERSPTKQVLWLGNSMLHSINRASDDDETATAILFARWQPLGTELLTLSFPNATMPELLTGYVYAASRLENLQVAMVQLTFDDFRAADIRAGLQPLLQDGATHDTLETSPTGRELLKTQTTVVEDTELAGLRDTVQERSEKQLNEWLGQYWPTWSQRPTARGRLLSELFRLRNTVFGINARSKRPLREATYQQSMAAIRALVAAAKTNGTTVLLYVPPLRTDVDPPYIAAEYDRFQQDVRRLATEEGALFANFGDVVPGPLWGMIAAANVGGEPDYDFMHFQQAGHALLADAVENALRVQRPETFE